MFKNISIKSILLFLLLIFYLYLIMNSVFVRTFEGMENEHVVDNRAVVDDGPASVVDNAPVVNNGPVVDNAPVVNNEPVSSVNTPNKKKDMMDILTSEK